MVFLEQFSVSKFDGKKYSESTFWITTGNKQSFPEVLTKLSCFVNTLKIIVLSIRGATGEAYFPEGMCRKLILKLILLTCN